MKIRFFRVLATLVLVASALVTLPVSPVRADTHTVTNTNDSGDGSLRAAVGSAVDGDTILFSGVSGTILLSSTIDINQSITITGPGSATLAVSGGDAVRIFYITGADVSISGLTITHGYVAGGSGGGIMHWQGNLTLEDVAVTYNQAVKSEEVPNVFGGGIVNYTSSLVITNSRLAYNTAERMGGAIYNYFDAGLSMTNVVVDHNQTLADGGGGLAIRGPNPGQVPPPVTLDRVSVTNNSAFQTGGGIFSDDSMTITNSLVAGNTTPDPGGGLYFNDSSTGAQPITISIINSTITANTSGREGGGIFFGLTQAASSATLNNVTIANNGQNLGAGYGAGFYQQGSGPLSLGNSILAGNLYNGSTPDDCDGSLVSLNYNLIQDLTHCTITGATDHNLTGVSAQLSDLADNGGPSQTMALLAASPARDAGNDLTCALTDQRGITRPQGPHCDMGAYELALYRLMVDKAGTEQGTVTSDPPGIDCGSTCSCYFVENTVVTLTATPFEGSAFDSWSSDVCSGNGTCTFTMDANKSVTAIFSLDLVRIFLALVFR